MTSERKSFLEMIFSQSYNERYPSIPDPPSQISTAAYHISYIKIKLSYANSRHLQYTKDVKGKKVALL